MHLGADLSLEHIRVQSETQRAAFRKTSGCPHLEHKFEVISASDIPGAHSRSSQNRLTSCASRSGATVSRTGP